MKEYVDKLDDNKIKSISVNELTQFRENWNIIHEVYDKDPRSKYTGDKIMKVLNDYFDHFKEDNNIKK